jgi:hypothetical protein
MLRSWKEVWLGASRKTSLVLGHESLDRLADLGTSTALKKANHVVGIVRRPDPVHYDDVISYRNRLAGKSCKPIPVI